MLKQPECLFSFKVFSVYCLTTIVGVPGANDIGKVLQMEISDESSEAFRAEKQVLLPFA